MHIARLAVAAALSAAAAACGQGNSDNMMVPAANGLSPAQVDLALGPEIPDTDGNELQTLNEVNGADSVETGPAAGAEPAADTSDAEPIDEPVDEAPADDAADSLPSDDNSAEQ